MKFKYLLKAFLLVLLFTGPALAQEECTELYGSTDKVFRLATGSPGELGLLKELADAFNGKEGTSLCWIKAGSGHSLTLLKEKQVDIILVHAPTAEKEAIKEGWAIKRSLIGSNEFYIVGPGHDPAHISSAATAAEAYARIAGSKALFLSRGDNSGTHKKEMSIWKMANITPTGEWYQTHKGFMMETLKKADETGGYFMTDSSTWVAGKNELKNMKILFKGDPYLINTYHGLCLPEGGTPAQPYASQFIDFLSSDMGQQIIREYGKNLYGQGMYDDAAYAKKYDH